MECMQKGGWSYTRSSEIDIHGAREFQRDVDGIAHFGPKKRLFPARINTLTSLDSIYAVCTEEGEILGQRRT
jgi:hypothetical protein